MMKRVFKYELPRFPGLDGTDNVDDFVNSFFEDKGAGYVNAVFAAPDDRAAKRITHKWVEHWLIDRTRQLPWGALRNRLEKRLERSSLFAQSAAAHYWFLTNDEDVDRPVTDAELREIANSTYIEVSTPSDQGIVRLGRTGELEEMLRRLLSAAGRLHVSTITGICADRFPSLMQSGDVLSSTIDVEWEHIEETETARDVATITASKNRNERLAEELLTFLTEQERTAIRFGDDAAALAEELGIGRSSAYSIIKKLRGRLIELAGDNERSREVLAALVRLVLDESSGVPSLENVDMENSRVI